VEAGEWSWLPLEMLARGKNPNFTESEAAGWQGEGGEGRWRAGMGWGAAGVRWPRWMGSEGVGGSGEDQRGRREKWSGCPRFLSARTVGSLSSLSLSLSLSCSLSSSSLPWQEFVLLSRYTVALPPVEPRIAGCAALHRSRIRWRKSINDCAMRQRPGTAPDTLCATLGSFSVVGCPPLHRAIVTP